MVWSRELSALEGAL